MSKYRYLIIIPLIIVCSVLVVAAEDSRPFWTEKSTFIEGDTLYSVGIASDVKTIEEGRELAFFRGRAEIINYAQIANLEGVGIVLETQMTYEERNQNGTFNVYRLLETDLTKLLSAQKNLQNTSKEKIAELDKMLVVNKALTETFVEKRRELEGLSRKGNEILSDLEKMKEDVEQKRTELETLYKKFQSEIDSREVIISELKKKTNVLEEQDKNVELLRQQIEAKIKNSETKVLKNVTAGMTMDEVSSLVGYPDHLEVDNFAPYTYWYYRTIKLRFYSTGTLQDIWTINGSYLGSDGKQLVK